MVLKEQGATAREATLHHFTHARCLVDLARLQAGSVLEIDVGKIVKRESKQAARRMVVCRFHTPNLDVEDAVMSVGTGRISSAPPIPQRKLLLPNGYAMHRQQRYYTRCTRVT